jgi:D-alanyl-D-alanine endopeptidase (penicillin-binding protein 7)
MTNDIDWAAARWAAFMWPAVWQATVVAALALAVVIPAVRRVSPRLAMVAASIALLKFFIPPVIALPIALVDRASEWLQPTIVPEWLPEVWIGRLMTIHFAGALVMLTTLAVRHRRLARMLATADEVTGGPLYADLVAAADALAIRRLPRLIVSERVDAPVAMGIRRPAIVLPAATAARVASDDLRLVLAHELVHHKMRDLLGELLLALAAAVWWFHPAVWMLAARVRELREERCDAIVVRTFPGAERYCRALLAVASTSLPSPAIAMRTQGHPLGRRFERLLSGRQPRRRQLVLAVLLVLSFGCTALPGSPRRDPWYGDDRLSAAAQGEIVRRDVRVSHIRKVRIR